MIKPRQDYLLVEVIENNTGVVKSDDIRDSLFLGRKGKVLAVGPGVWDHGVFIKTTTKVGEVVHWEEAAEANTPKEFKDREQAFVKEARLIAEGE
jgi:co-chaperonin GroES (HSP10)